MNEFKAGRGSKVSTLEPKMTNPKGAGARKEENKITQPGREKYGSNMISPVAKEGRRVPYGGETY